MKTRNDTFVLEGRAEPSGSANGTVFRAFSMAQFTPSDHFNAFKPNSTTIHVGLTNSNTLEIWASATDNANWTDVTSSFTALHNTSILELKGVFLSKPDNKTLVALFSLQISVKVQAKTGFLTVVLSAPNELMGDTNGLFGVWDENPDNDFKARNGTVLSPSSADFDIHFNFGQTCKLISKSYC